MDDISPHQDEAIARHREELLASHGGLPTEELVKLALEASARDLKTANDLLEALGGHPFTWTPPLIDIALERLEEDGV